MTRAAVFRKSGETGRRHDVIGGWLMSAQPTEHASVAVRTPRPRRPIRTLSIRHSRAISEKVLPGAARWERRFVLSLLALDIVIVAGAVVGGVFLRFGEPLNEHLANPAIAFVLVPLWIGLLAISRGYERQRINLGTEQIKTIFEASVRMAALVAFFVYLTRLELPRGFFLIALPGGFLALILGRVAARGVLHRARRSGRCRHRVVAVGTLDDIAHLIGQLERQDRHGLHVVGACAVTRNTADLSATSPSSASRPKPGASPRRSTPTPSPSPAPASSAAKACAASPGSSRAATPASW